MASDRGRKRLRKIAQLLLADAGNLAELCSRSRTSARHLAQRNIRKNDVGRHISLIGQFAAQDSKVLEERFVAFDFSGAMFWPLLLFDIKWFRQRDWLSFAQRGQTGFSKLERGKFSGRGGD